MRLSFSGKIYPLQIALSSCLSTGVSVRRPLVCQSMSFISRTSDHQLVGGLVRLSVYLFARPPARPPVNLFFAAPGVPLLIRLYVNVSLDMRSLLFVSNHNVVLPQVS